MKETIQVIFIFCLIMLWYAAIWAILLSMAIIVFIGFPYFWHARRKQKIEEMAAKEAADKKLKAWKELPR